MIRGTFLVGALTLIGAAAGLTGADEGPPPGGAEAGSRIFVSAEWHLAVDYPADWSINEDSDAVWFQSGKGEGIRLSRFTSDTPSEPARNRREREMRCSETTNVHGVKANVCVESVSGAYRADFLVKAGKSGEWHLLLETHTRGPEAFQAMVASLRPHP